MSSASWIAAQQDFTTHLPAVDNAARWAFRRRLRLRRQDFEEALAETRAAAWSRLGRADTQRQRPDPRRRPRDRQQRGPIRPERPTRCATGRGAGVPWTCIIVRRRRRVGSRSRASTTTVRRQTRRTGGGGSGSSAVIAAPRRTRRRFGSTSPPGWPACRIAVGGRPNGSCRATARVMLPGSWGSRRRP